MADPTPTREEVVTAAEPLPVIVAPSPPFALITDFILSTEPSFIACSKRLPK